MSNSYLKTPSTPREEQQLQRIDGLSQAQVIRELKETMSGHNYPWARVSQHLLSRFKRNDLILDHFEPGNILYEWIVLCDEKIAWNVWGGPSFESSEFNRQCLRNFNLIATQAGPGLEETWSWSTLENPKEHDIFGGSYAWKVADKTSLNCEFRGTNVFFYAEGPEFRLEYIYDRVEC